MEVFYKHLPYGGFKVSYMDDQNVYNEKTYFAVTFEQMKEQFRKDVGYYHRKLVFIKEY